MAREPYRSRMLNYLTTGTVEEQYQKMNEFVVSMAGSSASDVVAADIAREIYENVHGKPYDGPEPPDIPIGGTSYSYVGDGEPRNEPEPTKAVTVYLPEGYYEQLKAFAEIDKRSLSAEIVYFLAPHVEFVERRWDPEEGRGAPYGSDVRYPHSTHTQ